MGKGEDKHFYTNIPCRYRPSVYSDIDIQITDLSYSQTEWYTPVQQNYNDSLVHEGDANFRVTTLGTPKQAVVMMPAYRGDRGWELPHGVLPVEKFKIPDTLYMTFQDPFFVNGSYMLSNNYGCDPMPDIVKSIRSNLRFYNIREDQLTLVGSSKGANIAALTSQYFTGNKLIVVGYATNIERWITHTGQAGLKQCLDYYNVKIPDAAAILQHESEYKETHWFQSTTDPIANGELTNLTATNLSVYKSDEAHGLLMRTAWDEIEKNTTSF